MGLLMMFLFLSIPGLCDSCVRTLPTLFPPGHSQSVTLLASLILEARWTVTGGWGGDRLLEEDEFYFLSPEAWKCTCMAARHFGAGLKVFD